MSNERAGGQTVAEAYLTSLHTCGIKHVFANSGTDFAPLIEAMVRMKSDGRPAPEFITVPHENVAMAMAQGYSKITGEASCVMVHVNVGTANAVMGVSFIWKTIVTPRRRGSTLSGIGPRWKRVSGAARSCAQRNGA